jgi:hypothetical protein
MRLPRVRFTVRRMMVAVALLAAVFGRWLGVGRDQWRQHLNTEMTWSQSPVGEFYVKNGVDDFDANCLLKISELGAPDREGNYYRHRWWLGGGGELRKTVRFRNALGVGGVGGQNYLNAAELAQVQQIITKLPRSNRPYLQTDLILVSSFSGGFWVTKIYDKAALPAAVQDLVGVLQLRFR